MVIIFDTKLKGAFARFLPREMQVDRMLDNITQELQGALRAHIRRTPVLAVCSLVLAFALAIGFMPALRVNEQKQMEFAFVGLTMKVDAAEQHNGSLQIGMEFFHSFSKVEVSVTKGTISLPGDEVNGTSTIVLTDSKAFVWLFDDTAEAVLTFKGFDADGKVASAGCIDMSSGAVIALSQQPVKEDGTIYLDESGLDVEGVVLDVMNQAADELVNADPSSDATDSPVSVIVDIGE